MADIFSQHPRVGRFTALLSLCALATIAFLGLHWVRFAPLEEAENYVQDRFLLLGRGLPSDPRLVLIGIDRPSYAQDILPEEAEADPILGALRGNFPWSRAVWATLIERLATAGAKVIVIDLVFANPGEGDHLLQQALLKYKDQVVIACSVAAEVTERGTNWSLTVPYSGILSAPEEGPVALDDRVGLATVWKDEDGVLRRAQFKMQNVQLQEVVRANPEAIIQTLAARALRKLGEGSNVPEGFQSRRIRYSAAPGRGYPVQPIGDVLAAKAWKANYQDGAFFRDKLVLIGPTADLFHDFHRTPFKEHMAGPEIHLNIVNAALSREFLREFSPGAHAGFIGMAGLVAAALCQWMRQPVKRLMIFVVLGAVWLLAAYWMFDRANLVLPSVAPALVLLLCALGALAYDFIVERLERMKLRHTMGLYFSPRVLEAVLADPGSMNPRRAEITLLLTDLRNSTPLAETLGPQGMFDLLNRVFEVQTNAIMSEEGNLEHFLGDQFLSYWGAPQPQPDAVARAGRAAQKLITAMEQLRVTLSPEVQNLFGYGVALHSGAVLVGNRGSALRLDYGLVGDTVNEAARIEALTKVYEVKLLVSGDTFQKCEQRRIYRLVDRVVVKGKTEPVELYEQENVCVPHNYAMLCQRYQAAYDEYVAGQFSAAHAQFAKLVEEFSDGPSRVLAARCTRLTEKPHTGWTGIWKMESK